MNADDLLRLDTAAFDRAHARMMATPIELTDEDCAELGRVSKTLEAAAYEARRLAQIAVVLARTKGINPPPAGPAAGAAAATLDWEGIAEATVELIVDVVAPLKDKIATLERSNSDLAARVLELEAERAATAKVDA